MKLYPFQEQGVEWLKTREYALLADEQGLGKTVQAVVAAREGVVGKKLVICPASLKYVWDRAIKQWIDKDANIQIVQKGTDVIDPNAWWTICNYDMLLNKGIFTQVLGQYFSTGIFDESHYLKNQAAKRTKLILLRGGVASRCKNKWFLSGTPILNRPIELYPLLKAVAPEVMHPFTTYIGFAKYYCGGYYDDYGFNDRGASHMDELNVNLVKSGFMLRRLKKDVLTELPEKTFEIIPIDVKQKEEFKFFWAKDDITKVSFGDFFNKDDPAMLGQVAALRQYIAKEKLASVIAHISDMLLEKEKVVVFAHHRDIVNELMQKLQGYNPVCIMGGMSAEAKNESEKTFQNDKKCRVFVGNIAAAGVGITLTAADTVVFAELDWTPGTMFQAADRVHRIGQKNACLIQLFVTKDSIEEYMLRRLVEKKDITERVLDGIDIFS